VGEREKEAGGGGECYVRTLRIARNGCERDGIFCFFEHNHIFINIWRLDPSSTPVKESSHLNDCSHGIYILHCMYIHDVYTKKSVCRCIRAPRKRKQSHDCL